MVIPLLSDVKSLSPGPSTVLKSVRSRAHYPLGWSTPFGDGKAFEDAGKLHKREIKTNNVLHQLPLLANILKIQFNQFKIDFVQKVQVYQYHIFIIKILFLE